MKIKTGDKVKFLNSVGGGRVTKIEKDIAYVKDHDDFEMPVKITELIRDESSTFEPREETEAREPETGEPETREQTAAPSGSAEFGETADYWEKEDDTLKIYLGFVPNNENKPTEANIQVYLINDSNYFLLYNFAIPAGEQFNSKSNGRLEPNTKELLYTLDRQMLNELNTLLLQLIPFKIKAYKKQQPVDHEVKINPVKFFKLKSFRENDFFDEAAIIETVQDEFSEKLNQLSKNDTDKIIREKEVESTRLNTPKIPKKQKDPEQEEVDLHIHELLDDERGLSNKEMLELQMDYFRKKLQEAQKSKLKRIVFIHGVGNGTLKLELRKELQRNYSHLVYQDASFAEYGYGATMVYLK